MKMIFFDFIYSISVFTHLSDAVSRQWANELLRVSKDGAILVITTNGNSRRKFMLSEELKNMKQQVLWLEVKLKKVKNVFFMPNTRIFKRKLVQGL